MFSSCGLLLFLAAFTFLRLFMGPFFVALFVSYLINPITNRLERLGLRRTPIVASALSLSCIVGFLVFWFVVPLIITQFKVFSSLLPEAIDNFENNWLPEIVSRVQESFPQFFDRTPLDLNLLSITDLVALPDFSPMDLLLSSLGAGTQLIGSIGLFLFATPIFCFFIMRDFNKALDSFKSFVPSDLRAAIFDFAAEVDYTVRSVLSGQILVICLLSVVYAVTFFTIGLPGGLAIGIITGLSRIVPYLDIIIGGSLCFLILISNASPLILVVSVVLAFIIIQLIDGMLLTPRIVGQFAGLHPVVIIIAVMCFGSWFGFYGVLLAIPSTAVGRVLAKTLVRSYKNSSFFLSIGK